MVHAPILAIETSSSRCSVALYGVGVSVQIAEDLPRTHHKQILPMVKQILSNEGRAIDELAAIALGRGPGSFTGLRIGTGVVQGLAFAAGIPVITVSSLQAIALAAARCAGAEHSEYILTVLDAHMDEVYWCWYRRDGDVVQELVPESLSAPEAIAAPEPIDRQRMLLAGDAFRRYPHLLERFGSPYQDLQAEALDVARIAALQPRTDWREAQDAQPVYLRGSGAWKNLAEQRGQRR